MEIDHGEFKINIKPRELRPIKEYLEPQKRFIPVTDEQTEILQKHIREDWEALLKIEKEGKLPWF